ncbi:GNAT family N-acetyltransferase [bacterium]|nr:GNAT family N-acetyltransferase [bacterium]
MQPKPKIYTEGSSVYLREVCEDDAKLIYRWKQDPLIREMALGYDHQTTVEAEREDIIRAVESDMQIYLIIVFKATDKPIGYIRINWMDENKEFAWLRFSMAEHRHKGYMKDALRAFLTQAFALGLHRADAEVFLPNTASLKLLKGLGFKQEGLKREAYFDGKTYNDVYVMGLVRGDFVN